MFVGTKKKQADNRLLKKKALFITVDTSVRSVPMTLHNTKAWKKKCNIKIGIASSKS